MRKSVIKMGGAAILSAVLAFSAVSAAVPDTLETKELLFTISSYVGRVDERIYGTSTPHDGIDAYDESFMSDYIAGWNEENWLGSFFYVTEGSTVTLSLQPGYQGEKLFASPVVLALDDDGHIAYQIDSTPTYMELTDKPAEVFTFDNVNPMKNVPGANELMLDLPGDVRPEKLIFFVEVVRGEMQEEVVCSFSFRIATDSFDIKRATAIPAAPIASQVKLNGVDVSSAAYTINDNNYFKLRDVAKLLSGTDKQFDVTWDEEKQAIDLLSGKAYTVVGGELAKSDAAIKYADQATAKVYLNGKEQSITAFAIDGNNYFKLRDLGKIIDFGIGWDGAANIVTVDTSVGYTAE